MSVFLTILISTLALLITFYALHRVTDIYFVESLEIISHRLRMTSDIAGATLMAMGSSAPELFTSLLALVKGIEHANLGAGTIVGSAIFNILVIVGASVMMRPTVLTWQPVVRDMSFYILSILLLYWAFQDGFITFEESIFFIVFYVVYLISLPLWRRFFPYEDQATDASPMIKEQERATHARHPLLFMLLSPVDWIIARGLRFADCGSVKNDASDHPLVWAELELLAAPRTADSSAAKAAGSQADSHEVESRKR